MTVSKAGIAGQHSHSFSFMRHRRSCITAILLLCGSKLLYDFYGSPTSMARMFHKPVEHDDFDWFSLVPSTNILWTSCYTDFKCARLILPLDYLSPTGISPNVTIALQMLPATDRENYKGAILINPGGPGMPGTVTARLNGKALSRVAGGSYDIVGFDPRGTGASTPSAQCFDSDSQYQLWKIQVGKRLVNLSDDSVETMRAQHSVVGQKCASAIGGNGKEEAGGTAEEWGIGRFMGTASVARDLLEITQKLGQTQVNYWGFSYGTILGQYFAAMYPEMVGKMILDGVYDADIYRTALASTNLVDADAVVGAFYKFCHQAGPEKCPVFEESVDKIESRVDAIRKHIEQKPIAVPFAPGGPTLLTKPATDTLMLFAAYFPIAIFPTLANVLAAAENDDQARLAALAPAFETTFTCKSEEPRQWVVENQALYAIACGDSDPISYDPTTFRKIYESLLAESSLAAPIWGQSFLQCTEWPLRPKWRYTGPLAALNTSNPLLIVSPMYDPVCPLSHARTVHGRYNGSGLLVQKSYGHCSLAAPSMCTGKHIRAYLEDGILAEEGATCEVDELPLVGETVGEISADDRALLEALKHLARSI